MFKLPKDAKTWFQNAQASDVKSPLFVEEWDLYYLCLLYGITEGESDSKNLSSAQDMHNKFTVRYSSAKYSLLTLLIMTHANKLKIDLTDKNELEIVLKRFIDPEHESGLSTKAADKMNQYAYAGFEMLTDKVPTFMNSALAIGAIYNDISKKMDLFAREFK